MSGIIDIVYVIARPFRWSPNVNFIGFLKHSALLFKTIDGQYFKLDSEIKGSFLELHSNLLLIDNFIFLDNNKIKFNDDRELPWEIKMVHILLRPTKTIFDAQQFLYILTGIRSYNIIDWNCHSVQELVREYLGIKIKNKYMLKRVLNHGYLS